MENRDCGILVSYQCNAACRHCFLACSPKRSGGYMTPEIVERICHLLKERGIKSVHIGGGEPFLNFEGLMKVIETVHRLGFKIDYVETNGFWVADEETALAYLTALKKAGVKQLLISLDPYHAEYVPIALPLRLVELCQRFELEYILLKETFQELLAGIDHDKIYSRAELEKEISPQYVLEVAKSYGLSWSGRSVRIEAEYSTHRPLDEIVAISEPCRYLLKTKLFHIDVYERYVMTCTGIAFPLVDAIRGIPKGKYPVLETLVAKGPAGLLAYAKDLGFKEENTYPSPCSLCFHIRHWLSENGDLLELDSEYYQEALAHY